jgi:hypothetical protein
LQAPNPGEWARITSASIQGPERLVLNVRPVSDPAEAAAVAREDGYKIK